MTTDPTGYPPFLGSELPNRPPAQARFHVLPAPWERSTSYGGGTGRGPSAILQASWQLETWDGHGVPGNQGIHTHAPVDVTGEPGEVLERIAGAVEEILALDKIPIVLGGEHTVTYGVVQGYLNAGYRDIGVVQIDAHADLRESYEGDPWSHACVMRLIADAGVPLYQLGVRALCQEEVAARQALGVPFLDAETLVPERINAVQIPADFPPKLFFTIDVDGIDPSVFPATGTPVPGGLSWYQTLGLFESVATQRHIVGLDLMEFAPLPDLHGYDFSAALLVYKLMGILQRTSCTSEG